MTKLNKRNILKIIIDVILFVWFVILLVNYFCGKSTTIEVIAICLYLITMSINCLRRARYYRKLMTYEELFKMLVLIHKARYQAYLENDEEEFENISEVFEVCAQTMIDIGKILLEDNGTRRGNRKQIQKIMDKVQNLIQTMEPPTA